MDPNESKKWDMHWYDWLVFAVPTIFIVSLGLESAFGTTPGPGTAAHRDFRAVAHWFDPVFFQYNLIMTLVAVLVVPSLALSYTMKMANRKECRLYRDVPPERRGEIRQRMGRRASFGTYRGSVWLTTVVVLLGSSILLLFKPVSSSCELGVDFSLGANMLTMGPFMELYETNRDSYYSHLVRNLTAFQFGFLGAYVYFIGSVVRAYFTMDLTSNTFVDGTIRMIVASLLALVLSFAFDLLLPHELDVIAPSTAAPSDVNAGTPAPPTPPAGEEPREATSPEGSGNGEKLLSKQEVPFPARLSLLPLVAFFLGFYPKRAALGIERIVVKLTREIIPAMSYRALPLSMLAGMSYSHELRLEREGFDNIENLSNADPVDLAIRTCFSYSQLKQWIDQAWLASHLREDYPGFAQRTGITNSEELHCFFSTCEASHTDGVEQLLAALSADTATIASWRLRLNTLRILLNTNSSPQENKHDLTEREHRAPDIARPEAGTGSPKSQTDR
ncbi:hypothetical protein C8R21_108105 [Nitrosospira multiformis]|uniref:Uncharacterized protein n=1 Tax=Nitrosospira multiformis TaxID=1231 RepID=A0A2T5ID19_9PROT|nr:hypothetical protein [Nitrosospira multiformis]PTQ81727.1 hypothetical protein C8R21_108105 [Nitrosospira multiformis]